MSNEAQAYKKLIDIGLALSREKHITKLLERILAEAKSFVNADGGVLYLVAEKTRLDFTIAIFDSLGISEGGSGGSKISFAPLELNGADGLPNLTKIATLCANKGVTVNIDNVYRASDIDPEGSKNFDLEHNYRSQSFLTVPLKNHKDDVIGVLQLINATDDTGNISAFSESAQPFIEALASQASVAIENRSLLDEQLAMQDHLKQQVEDRTEELKNALSNLSEAHISLKDLTTFDAVTGIRNRKYFDDVFALEWRRAARQKHSITLMLLDIDYFKLVNDTYGHLAGDECLSQVAMTIDNLFKRPSDVVARYGGEEFAVVLPYLEEEKAAQKAEQVRAHVEALTVKADGNEFKVTISIGWITAVPDVVMQPRELLSRADRALYQAKSDGRNAVRSQLSLV